MSRIIDKWTYLYESRRLTDLTETMDDWFAAKNLRDRCLAALEHIDEIEQTKAFANAAMIIPEEYPELRHLGPRRLAEALGMSLNSLWLQYERFPTVFDDIRKLMYRASKRRKAIRLYLQENRVRLSCITIPAGRT